MSGRYDDAERARRRPPDWYKKMTQPPPHEPRHKKSAEPVAQANADAFAQNGHLQVNALPIRPSGGYGIAAPSGLAPAATLSPAAQAQGYHARSQSHSAVASQRAADRERPPPPAFGLVSPPQPPQRPVEERGRKRAPYPPSMYGDKPEPEPRPKTFGLLSSPTGPSPYRQASPAAPARLPPIEVDSRDSFEPGFVHPRVPSQSSRLPTKPARSPSPQPYQRYPLTPPDEYKDRQRSTSTGLRPSSANSATAAHNQSAFFQNSATQGPYAALGKSEIRLIRIPYLSPGPLRLEFVNASITNPPPYTALSYAWGTPRNKVGIELNGYAKHINSSLYNAIRKLQCPERDILCWADAVCINQDDPDEVTEQVLSMRDIYSQASAVAVWLGPVTQDSGLALRLLETISKHAASRNEAAIHQILMSAKNHDGFAALVALFERDYWRRVWVVQEVLNAKYVTIHCGQSTMSWSSYQRVSAVFQRNAKDIDQMYSPWASQNGEKPFISAKYRLPYSQVLTQLGPGSFREMQAVLDSESEIDPASAAARFLTTLCITRSKSASDPKDKVYSLLGILPDDVQRHIIPDYRLSVRDIYTKVARYIITTTSSLSAVCNAFHFPVHTSALGLPSWVPDWSQVSSLTAIDSPGGRFSAGTEKSDDIVISDEGTLGFKAVFVDEVEDRGIAMGTVDNNHDLVVVFLHWFAILQQRLKTLPWASPEEMEEKFCRMLALDNVHPLFTAPGLWRTVTLHVFAALAAELIPEMPMHQRLARYVKHDCLSTYGISADAIIRESFLAGMIGRSLFFTKNGIMGMGSGYLAMGDLVVVPFGCSTPLMLRADGEDSEYRLVGDAYVEGFMNGFAITQWRRGKAETRLYHIH